MIDLVGGRAEAQRQQDEMAAEFQQGLDRTPVEADPRLQSAAQAKAQRRSIGSAEQALGVTPKTSFAQAEASPDVLSPDVQDIKTEIPSEIPSAGFTQAEASAFAKQAAGKGFEMDRFERQARATALPKMEAAEKRHTGTKTVYDSPHSPQKEAIISNAVELVDLTDADMDSTLVPNAIEQASQDAELAGTKLTVEDKLEILSRIDNKLDNEINSSGSVTVQDGLEAFADALDKARKYVKKSTDKKIGANLGLITSQMKLALDAAILATKAGLTASDVIDVGISNLKLNLKNDGMRLTDSRVDELIERLSNYIVMNSVVQDPWTKAESVKGKIDNLFFGSSDLDVRTSLDLELDAPLEPLGELMSKFEDGVIKFWREGVKGTGNIAEGYGRYATTVLNIAEYYARGELRKLEEGLIYEYDVNISKDNVLNQTVGFGPKDQPKAVQKAWYKFVEMLEQENRESTADGELDLFDGENAAKLRGIYENSDTWTGSQLYYSIVGYFGKPFSKEGENRATPEMIRQGGQRASKFLKDNGVDAMSYRRQDSRFGPDPHTNYVILNTDKVRVVSVKDLSNNEVYNSFTKENIISAKEDKSGKLRKALKVAGKEGLAIPEIALPKKGGEFDARANIPASLFGDISSEWGKTSEASSVLTHIKKEFTEETSPSTEEISKLLLESSEDSQAKTTKERIKTAKKWLDDIGARPENGTVLKGRIDVPTFIRDGKYVNSIDHGSKIIGYDNILTLDVAKGVDPFSVSKTAALNIAKGKVSKTKIAFVQGGFVNSRLMPDGSIETSDGEKISATDLHDPAKYMQISMNPRRTDYFYNRSSGMRIKGAKVGTRLYQVGGTVFVRRKGGEIIQDRGNSTGMIARLKRLKGQTTKYLNQNRGRTSSLPVDVLIAQLANSSLSLTIEAVVYGKKTVDAAAEMAWNAIDKSKRILIDEKDFKSELIKRLKVALDIILDGNSTKAAVQQTKQAYSNLSMVDAEQADGVLDARRNDPVLRGDPLIKGALSSFKKQVKGREGVPVDGPVADPAESDVSATETLIQDMGIDIEAADAAPLIVRRQESWINKFIGGFLRGSLNTAAKAGSFGLNLLAQRSKIAINKRAYYEGRYRLLDEDGREIEVDEETEIEVDSYLRAKAARDNIRKKAVRKPLKPSEVKVYQTELPPISDKGLRLAQEIERVFEISGQDALAAGVMQKQSDGSYELGNFSLGKGGYFHAIKSKYLNAMRAKFSSSSMSNDQIADLKEFQEEQGLSDEGLEKLYNESTADPTAKVTSGSSTSKLSPMESPRRKELSLNVIDFTPSGFNSRMRSWAKRLSEIEAYGQDTDVNTNIFDLYIKQFKKDEYKHKDGVAELVRWLEDAKDVAYETPFGTKGGAGWATSAGGRFLNRSTSVLMLASFASMITQLTSIGFTASKAKRLGSFRSFIKGFLSAIASGDLLKGDAVRGLGLITGSMGSHQGFMAEDSPMSKASKKLGDKLTRAGLKGVAITDAISRTVSLHQSKALVEQVKDSVKEGINPDIVESFGKHAKRMGVNPEDVINGDPKAEAEYLVGSVFEVQGSYRLQQLPTLMRNPAWQSLLKFSPFAFQVGSEVAEQIRTTGEDGGAIGQTKYILWTAAIMGLTEEMRALAFEKLFGRERNVATLNEIMAQETFLGKANLSGRRVMADLIDVGILGQIGYMITGSRYARGDFSFSDLANLSVLDKGIGLASDYQQGKLTKDELFDRFVRGNIKFMKDYWGIAGTSERMRESYTYALKEQRRRQFYKLKNVAERYEADTGNRLARGSGEGTDLTKYKRAVSEQLLLGDIDKAREKAIEFAELSTDREKSWTVLTQSLKARSPLQLIGLKSESDRQAFVNWASQNLTLEDQRDILEAHTEYVRTGLRSGLIRIQGEADLGYPDNVRQMKLMMTGKAPETTYSRPTLYRGGGSYKDLIRKHKADLNR